MSGVGYANYMSEKYAKEKAAKNNSNVWRGINAGESIMGPDGLRMVGGGTNQYGQQRPGTVLMRNEAGELSDRFLQTMSPEYLALQQKAMTEGDTESATLAREMQGLADTQQRDTMSAQAASALTGGMQNLAMRGGAGQGSRERLNRDISRNLMAGTQGIGRDSRMANLAISQQDEQMKNSLLAQTGQVGQQIQEGNIGRLQQDIRDQNIGAHNQYKEDMQAYGAIQSGNAQARASSGGGGTVICTAFKKRGLISDEDKKASSEFGQKILLEDCETGGHSFKAYNLFLGRLISFVDRNKSFEKPFRLFFKPFVEHVSGRENLKGKLTLIAGRFLCDNLFYFTKSYRKSIKRLSKKESEACHC